MTQVTTMDNFAYDAPDFLDFSKDLEIEDVKKAEAFFESEHNNHYGVEVDTKVRVEDTEKDFEQEFFTPMKEPSKLDTTEICLRSQLRKSLSMNNLPTEDLELQGPDDDISTISDAMEGLVMSGRKKSINPNRKYHPMLTRSGRTTLNLRSRSISRDHIDKLAQPKRKNISHEDLQAKKYISMAEAINQFQQKTPKRFHSKSKTDLLCIEKQIGPKPNTIPHSPALATKQRARAHHIMSREEQELKEYEEAKKYKIKANPVNPKVLNGPIQAKPPVFKKPTKPEPFKLTEVPIKKPPTPTKTLFEFHAKPVPKSVLAPPKPIIKSLLYTNPHTPKMMKRYPRVDPKNETITESTTKTGPFKAVPTKLEPFSFEQRDKEVLKKREQLVNEVLEEERKAREFHARPLPKSIFKSPQSKNSTISYQKRQKSDSSLYKSAEDMNEAQSSASSFKARPAKVLQMKPFEPKKDEEHHIEIAEFQLSTYYRAKQREEFELKKKQKEDKIALYIKQRDEEYLRQEQEEKARIRKETEHKAQPIRRYKDLPTVPTKKLTAPISPKFNYGKIKNEYLIMNKENSLNDTNTGTL